MQLYYFDVTDGNNIRDTDGTPLPSAEAARAHAMRVAAEFTTKPGMLSKDGGAIIVTVRTAEEGTVLTVRLVFNVE